MAYEKREGDIAVFQQTDKSRDRSPDWKGDALIDGKTYEVALWNKGGKGTMLAGQIKVKDETFQRGGGSGVRTGGSQGVSGGGRDDPSYAIQNLVTGSGGQRVDRRAAAIIGDVDYDDEIPFATNDSIW